MERKTKIWGLEQKLLLILVSLILLPFLAASAILFLKVYHNAFQSENALRRINLENMTARADGILEDYEEVIEQFYESDLLISSGSQGLRHADRGAIMAELSKIRRTRGSIANVALIFPDGASVYSNAGYTRYQYIEKYNAEQMELYRGQMEGKVCGKQWRLSVGNAKAPQAAAPLLACSKTVKNIYNHNETIGVVVMHLSSTIFEPLEKFGGNGVNQNILILDENQNLIWRQNPNAPDAPADGWNAVLTERAPLRLHSYEKQFFYMYQTSAYNGWHYIQIVSPEEVNRQVDAICFYFSVILLLILAFSCCCYLFLRHFIVHPIKKLIIFMNSIDDLQKINLRVELPQNDEVGSLYQTFNQMNRRIHLLVKQLTELHRRDREKELKLLQSQLNPHFIYNTLDSISWVTYERGLPEASRALTCLSRILRYSIKHAEDFVSFREELEELKNYLYIQRFRFEERFQVDYRIEEEYLDYQTMKFVFQPFVENALIHGFRDMEQGCRISIVLTGEGEDILVEITDNGRGISKYRLNEIREHETAGIGIHNIDTALQLRFGKAYRLNIVSREGLGTTVKMRLPKIRKEGANGAVDPNCGSG